MLQRLSQALCVAFAVLCLAPTPLAAQRAGPRNFCVSLGTLVTAQGMDSSQSWTVSEDTLSGYDVITIHIALTDANGSIGRFDLALTVSDDNNATDYVAQSCTVAAGVCTSTPAVWRKASPGTANWAWRIKTAGYEDVQFTASVGAGSGAAADVVTIKGRACVVGA